jgi:hypothetical protein
LSFINSLDAAKNFPFERFVLDTRYTVNLLILTLIVSLIGGIVYIGFSILLGSHEVWNFFSLIKRVFWKHKVTPIPAKEQEPVAPTPTDSSS